MSSFDVLDYGTAKDMSLRAYFAVQVMQAMLEPGKKYLPAELAKAAVKYADALIAELEKDEQKSYRGAVRPADSR